MKWKEWPNMKIRFPHLGTNLFPTNFHDDSVSEVSCQYSTQHETTILMRVGYLTDRGTTELISSQPVGVWQRSKVMRAACFFLYMHICWWMKKSGVYQLRLVIYPIIYRVLYIPGGCLGFLPSTVYSGYILYKNCVTLRTLPSLKLRIGIITQVHSRENPPGFHIHIKSLSNRGLGFEYSSYILVGNKSSAGTWRVLFKGSTLLCHHLHLGAPGLSNVGCGEKFAAGSVPGNAVTCWLLCHWPRNLVKFEYISKLPSLKLTVCTWKWMLGRRSFPSGKAYFQTLC